MFPIHRASRAPLFLLLATLLCTSYPAVADDSNDGKSGYLGVILQDLGPGMAKALQLDDDSGVLVGEVTDDSPADEAGLEDGDVILVFDGKRIEDSRTLSRAVRKSAPGDEVKVVVLREGKKKTIEVKLGEREDDVIVRSSKEMKDLHSPEALEKLREFKWRHPGDGDFPFLDADRGFLGVHLDDLSGQLGEYFGVEDGAGALVTGVVEDSPAERAGIRAGDVIVKIDGEPVDSTRTLHKVMAGTESEQEIEVEVVRKGDGKSFDVTLDETSDRMFSRKIELIGDDRQPGVRALEKEIENLKRELQEIREKLEK